MNTTNNHSTMRLTGDYLTVAQVKDYLNISQAKAYELTHRKDFPVCRLGGTIRIPTDLFLRWVGKMTYVPNWMEMAA